MLRVNLRDDRVVEVYAKRYDWWGWTRPGFIGSIVTEYPTRGVRPAVPSQPIATDPDDLDSCLPILDASRCTCRVAMT